MSLDPSIGNEAARALIAGLIPKAPLEIALGQSMAMQSKALGIGVATDKGKEVGEAAISTTAAMASWPKDDPLKVALNEMFIALGKAVGGVAAQAAETPLPK